MSICQERLRGLKSHQRTCNTLKTVSQEPSYDSDNNEDVYEDDIGDEINNLPDIKQGVSLPTAPAEWNIANLAENLSTTVYNYFKDNCGVKKKVKKSRIYRKV